MLRCVVNIFFIIGIVTSLSLHAAVPVTINFQGYAADKATGVPLNGSYDITFKLWDVSSGGTLTVNDLWTETWNTGTSQVAISDGVFAVSLGTHTLFSSVSGLFGQPLYLGIKIGTDPEMIPRQPVVSVPYAFVSDAVTAGAITSSMLDTDAVQTGNIKDGAVTAAKIDSTGLDADTIDGFDKTDLITDTDGGTIAGDITMSGSGKIVLGSAGMKFDDGTTQITAAITAAGGSTINVTCNSASGGPTPLQDAIDALGPGGFYAIVISGECKENIRATRTRLEIRGNTGAGTDKITCDTTDDPNVVAAVQVRDPFILWLNKLNVNCSGKDAVHVWRNGVIGMYGSGGDKVTLTGSATGASAKDGGTLLMFDVSTSTNTRSSVTLRNGATAVLRNVNFTETIDTDSTNSSLIEIQRNSSAQIDGGSTVINNTSTGDSAISLWQDSSLNVDGSDTAAITGDVECNNSSAMSLNDAIFNGEVNFHNCDGILNSSDVNGGSLTVGGNVWVDNNNGLDLANINVNIGGDLVIGSSNVFDTTEPDINVYGGSIQIDEDLTFEAFSAIGPGFVQINGTLTDDSDSNDDFRVSKAVLVLDATFNGNLNIDEHGQADLNANADVKGGITVATWSRLEMDGSAKVQDCIEVRDHSYANIDDGVVFGTGDTNHDKCWTGGASLYVKELSKVQIGGGGSGATIVGDVTIQNGSIMRATPGSDITGIVDILRDSQGYLDGADVTGQVYVGEGSSLEMNNNANVDDNGVSVNDNSSLTFTGSSTNGIEDCVEASGNSTIRIRNGGKHGSITGHDPCWSGGPSIRVGDASILRMEDGALVNGAAQADSGSFIKLNKDADISGNVDLRRGAQLEMGEDNVITGTLNAGPGTQVEMYEATITGDLQLNGAFAQINNPLAGGKTINGAIYAERSTIEVRNAGIGNPFDPGDSTKYMDLNYGSQLFIDNDAVVQLEFPVALNHHSRLVIREGADVSRSSNSSDLVNARSFSVVQVFQGDAPGTMLKGVVVVDDTSQLNTTGWGNTGVVFDGDLNLGQAPSRAYFNGTNTDVFIHGGTPSINCDPQITSAGAVGNGVLTGKMPDVATYSGTIDSDCVNQTTGTPAPGAFGKSSPVDTATGVSTDPTLSWDSSTNAVEYESCYDTTINNACDASWDSAGTSTSRDLSGLSNSTQYEWHVRAKNATSTTYSDSGSSDFWTFTTEAP